jgi:putative transposase
MDYSMNIANPAVNINCGGCGWSTLRDGVIQFIRLAMENILHSEQLEQLGCKLYERSHRRTDYANGFYRRTLSTTYGVITDLAVPRLRCKRFESQILERYRRRSRELDEALLAWYLQGESCRDTTRSLQAWAGDVLSAQSISRIIQQLDHHLLRWRQRPLPQDLRAVWLDGFSVKVRVKRTVRCYVILAALGRHANGQWEVLSFRLAESESEQRWRELLHQMFIRGMRTQLFIHDGAEGIVQALRWDYPLSKTQRCLVHKLRNVLDALIHCEHHNQIKRDFWSIYNGDSLASAHRRLYAFCRTWSRREPHAVAVMRSAWQSTMTFFILPPDLRAICRSTNMLEFVFKELRRRVKVIGAFPTPQSCERIIFITLLYIEHVNLNKSGNIASFLSKFTHK